MEKSGKLISKNYKFSVFSPIDLIFIFYIPILIILSLKTIPNNQNILKLYLIYFILYIGLIVIIYMRHSRSSGVFQKKLFNERTINFIMLLYPVIYLFTIFESLGYVIPYFIESSFDGFFSSLDNLIFGKPPSILLEGIINPIITEIMYIFYFLYFPVPLILIGALLIKKELKNMEELYVIYLICYFGAYIMFFIFPVFGPRYYLYSEYSVQLTGYYFSKYITQTIDYLEPNKFDCFPSLHCAVLIVTALLSYRYNRRFFYIVMPVIIIILFTLIYCRYHYFVDLLAGGAWAILSYYLGLKIYTKYNYKFSQHFKY